MREDELDCTAVFSVAILRPCAELQEAAAREFVLTLQSVRAPSSRTEHR